MLLVIFRVLPDWSVATPSPKNLFEAWNDPAFGTRSAKRIKEKPGRTSNHLQNSQKFLEDFPLRSRSPKRKPNWVSAHVQLAPPWWRPKQKGCSRRANENGPASQPNGAAPSRDDPGRAHSTGLRTTGLQPHPNRRRPQPWKDLFKHPLVWLMFISCHV